MKAKAEIEPMPGAIKAFVFIKKSRRDFWGKPKVWDARIIENHPFKFGLYGLAVETSGHADRQTDGGRENQVVGHHMFCGRNYQKECSSQKKKSRIQQWSDRISGTSN